MSLQLRADAAAAADRAADAAPCLICKERCSGFQPHFWRKACVTCGCGSVDHMQESDLEDDQKMGRLLADSPYSHLTAKVKGGGGLRMYKRNRMIVTNPVVSGKDPTFNTTTYDWAPAGLNQKLALQYMELLPESLRPVSGSAGSLERRRQLLHQLPAYDHDPMKCGSVASEEEITTMLLFVKQYKQEVLGVGEVALPGESAALLRTVKESEQQQGHTTASLATAGFNGRDDTTEYCCTGCKGEVAKNSPVVYAEHAGYHGAMWHPTCFRCSECSQSLVDLVYFWSCQKLLCGRHYCQSVWPRCSGCDELIFCRSFFTSKDGQTWHQEHYCCWRCGVSLDTPCQH